MSRHSALFIALLGPGRVRRQRPNQASWTAIDVATTPLDSVDEHPNILVEARDAPTYGGMHFDDECELVVSSTEALRPGEVAQAVRARLGSHQAAVGIVDRNSEQGGIVKTNRLLLLVLVGMLTAGCQDDPTSTSRLTGLSPAPAQEGRTVSKSRPRFSISVETRGEIKPGSPITIIAGAWT
ncbi:MAG: hypothetical protein ACRENP_29090 [Longimicrobiales bacterium]